MTARRPPEAPDPEPDQAPTLGLGGTPPLGGSPSATRLAAGDVLGGRFRIVRFIGRGGMGEVYEAEDLELGERMALKTIRAEIAADRRAMERFKREVHLARKVTHPNVCRLFDLERHHTAGHEVTFLTMELVTGETLAERLRRGPITAGEALLLSRQVVEGLAAAHRAGVAHGDLKPANVILQGHPEGVRAVVTDFGLAGIAGEEAKGGHAGGMVMGTPGYMAPEQASGGQASPASDVYSLGVTIHEVLAGRRPGEEASALPPETAAWGPVIARCLQPDPARRFADAREVLGALAAGEGRAAPAVPAAPQPGRSRLPWVAGVLALAAVAAVALLLRPQRRPEEAHTPAGRVVPLQITSSSGLDVYPSFSADGSQLAYSSDHSGRSQIYVRPLLADGRDRPLTTADEDHWQPAWSPDGRWIAYHARGGLWLVPSGGGAPRQLTTFGSRPSWSPDGESLVFQSQALVELAANAFPALPPSTLWIVPREGGEPRAVTRAGQPAGGHGAPSWSPDGRRIVFVSADRRLARIWSVAPDGSGLAPLVHDQPFAFDPVWSADGRRVYYSAFSDSYGVWQVPVDPRTGQGLETPRELINLGSGAARIRHLAVSRDGRRLAYGSLLLSANLWWLPLSPQSLLPAGAARPLTSGMIKVSRPSFSRDGARLAYDRDRAALGADVWVMDPDGGNAEALTTHAAEDTLASWFPDGRRVAFLTNRDGEYALWTVGVDERVERPLVVLDQDMDWPRLSPDGTQVAFNSKRGSSTINTWLAPVGGGPARQVTFDTELLGFPCWSPDGSMLALEMKRGDDTHVALLPAGGGTPVQLTADPGQSWPYTFAPDGDRIAFAGQRGGIWNVWSVSRATRAQVRLTDHRRLGAYVRTPAWSPRGDRIVYEYAETTGNVWMIELPR